MAKRYALGAALNGVLEAQGMTLGALAAKLGVSRKTLERWRLRSVPDSEAVRRQILHALRDAPREQLEPLAELLDVDLPPRPDPSPAMDRGELDAAIYAVAEGLDESPRRVRASFAAMLDRLTAAGFVTLDVAAVRALLFEAAGVSPRSSTVADSPAVPRPHPTAG